MSVKLTESDQGWLETAAQLFREAANENWEGKADLLWCAKRCDELALALQNAQMEARETWFVYENYYRGAGTILQVEKHYIPLLMNAGLISRIVDKPTGHFMLVEDFTHEDVRVFCEYSDNRCEDSTGGGRYHCVRAKGHKGYHMTYNPFARWSD